MKYKCPDCGSEKYYHNGITYSRAKQRYCCLKCGTTWYEKRIIPPEEIKGY